MTAVRVSRLAVRCVAPHGAQARALDARTRLARVASGPLAGALDRLLGDVDADVRVATLRVPLDLDPAEYDDETLAHLWASRIAAALAPHLTPGATAAAPPAGPVPAMETDASTWAAAIAAMAPYEVAAVAALLVAREGAVAALYAALPASARATVLAALARAASATAPPATGGRTPTAAAALAVPAPPATPLGSEPDGAPAGNATAWAPAWHRAARAATKATPPGATARVVAGAAARLAAVPAAPSRTRAPGLTSTAGGLVLLYPWLAAYAGAAVAAYPELVPEDVRRAAFAALVAPGDPLAQRDPLVRLLAGVALDAATPHCAAEADGDPVLRAFAGLLRGFEESSPDYLRTHLLRRPAEIVDVADAVLVRLAPMPLDVVLRGLPYPLGVVRLPWTPPVAVELRWR